MNKIFLVGNLTRDPELSTIPNGTSVCKFAIAVNRQFAGKDGNKETDFFNIAAWRAMGENCAKFIKKGSKVGVVGRLEIRNYEKDGEKKQFVEVIADEVEFLSPKGAGVGGDHYEGGGEMTPISDDSLPF